MEKTNNILAIMSHCLLNSNASVSECASDSGVVRPVWKILNDHEVSILQLPCPETTYLGINRWWHSYEMYDNPGYREYCYKLAQPVVEQAKKYQEKGYRIVLIAVDGSPSCGLFHTGSQTQWGGRPEGGEHGGSNRVSGKGVWMEILTELMQSKGIGFYKGIGIQEDNNKKIKGSSIADIESLFYLENNDK